MDGLLIGRVKAKPSCKYDSGGATDKPRVFEDIHNY